MLDAVGNILHGICNCSKGAEGNCACLHKQCMFMGLLRQAGTIAQLQCTVSDHELVHCTLCVTRIGQCGVAAFNMHLVHFTALKNYHYNYNIDSCIYFSTYGGCLHVVQCNWPLACIYYRSQER